MSSGFRALPAADLTRAVEELLLPRLAGALREKTAGHCMRVTDLDRDLMVALARGLRKEAPGASVYILADGVSSDQDLYVSSTKLVELRNPLPDGSLRPPLCVFLPVEPAHERRGLVRARNVRGVPGWRRLSGSSPSIARTGASHAPGLRPGRTPVPETISVGVGLVPLLRSGISSALSPTAMTARPSGARCTSSVSCPTSSCSTTRRRPTGASARTSSAYEQLTDSDQSIRSRVLQLDLVNKGLRRRLAEYLVDAGVEDPVAWTREVVLNKTNWDLSFDKWEFASEIAPDKIAFVRVETDLPVVAEDEKSERLVDLVGQQVLAPKDRRQFNVTVEVSPHPESGSGAGVLHGPDHVA